MSKYFNPLCSEHLCLLFLETFLNDFIQSSLPSDLTLSGIPIIYNDDIVKQIFFFSLLYSYFPLPYPRFH